MIHQHPSPAPVGRVVLNLVAFVGVIVGNGLAGAGVLSGRSIGEIANSYAPYFLPDGYVFGIWSLIYLALAGFCVYQALPSGRRDAVVAAIGYRWAINAVLNVGWLIAFSFGQFLLAWVLMLGLLVSLIDIEGRLRWREADARRRAFVVLPFRLYLSWIAVATIANTAQQLVVLGWDGSPWWAVAMMTVATALAGAMAVLRAHVVFPVVVAWALAGIAVRYPDILPIVTAAAALSAFCVVFTAMAFVRLRAAIPRVAEGA